MIDNETVRKASEIGIIDVVDAIKLIETNPAYITLTFDEKKIWSSTLFISKDITKR